MNQKKISYILSLCLLLFALNANSSTLVDFCKRLFFPQSTWPSGRVPRACPGESTGSIFMNFARERLGDKFSVNSEWDKKKWDKWEKEIRMSLENWTSKEANLFLQDLEARIGERATIKSIQYYPSLFQLAGYKKFRETVSFYESFIGEKAVTKHLKQTLKGFFYTHSLKELKRVVDYFQNYVADNVSFQEEHILERIVKDLGDFAKIKLNDLKEVVKYLEKRIGKKETQKKMRETFRFFSSFFPKNKLQELQKELEKPRRERTRQNIPFRDHFNSWFEAEVFFKIASKGYWVIPQYGVSGNWIDMIIIGYKGKLAVEADGKKWHSGKRKDKDFERQNKLEKLGWEFWRVSDRDFNRNEELALKDLWEKLDEIEIYPIDRWETGNKPSFFKRIF